jgi:hypothetical protein
MVQDKSYYSNYAINHALTLVMILPVMIKEALNSLFNSFQKDDIY